MKSAIIAMAIPFFIVLMVVEYFVARKQSKSYYRLNDTVSNLNNGIGQQVIAVFSALIFTYFYISLEDYRLWTLPADSWITWVVTFFIADLIYYIFHRASHRVNFIWATHVVHHSSEEYNLSVALRQSWLQGFISSSFHLPLALLGFPFLVVATNAAIVTVLQFWFHTRTIKRMGFLESFLNTPSHHRVHHGRNPKYLDKNYAGVLIIWDRMFGTFMPEQEEPVYGIVKPLNSWKAWHANTHYWRELWTVFRLRQQKESLFSAIRVFIEAPEQTFGAPSSLTSTVVYDYKPPQQYFTWLVSLLTIAAIALLVMYLQEVQPDIKWLLGASIMAIVLYSGRVLENR